MNLKDLVGETTLNNMEQITQGLKLRELLEKRIEEIDNQLDRLHYEGVMASASDNELITVKFELQNLLEESKR